MVVFWQIRDFGFFQQSQTKARFLYSLTSDLGHYKCEKLTMQFLRHASKGVFLEFYKELLSWCRVIKIVIAALTVS